MILSQAWSDKGFAELETLYHNANGYIGVRNSPEEGESEGSIRGAYINAFYELVDISYGEKLYGFPETKQTLVNVPDAQTIILEAGGERYSMFESAAQNRRQTLDTEAGLTARESLWQHKYGDLLITISRMASFAMPNVFVLKFNVTSRGYAGPVRLFSTLNGDVRNYAKPGDPRAAAEKLRCLKTREVGAEGGEAFLVADTCRSGLRLCCRVAHTCPLSGSWALTDNAAEAVFEGRLSAGESVELVKIVVYTDSLRVSDPVGEARRIMSEALSRGADQLFAAQAHLLKAWRRDAFIALDAPAPLADALDYNLFELLQSVGEGAYSVAAKGLSGEGYEGHTFWDSEIYVFPFFLWTQPDKARGMLEYRYAQLDKARANARVVGFQTGALYPWRTINGGECSAFFPAGTAQYHINGDIAYAFLQYWLVVGDAGFMADMGAEVLVETARMWLELGHMEEDGFRIDCVTGPDEYTCLVNNNFYTNAAAQYNLRGAAEVLKALEKSGLDARVRQKTGVTRAEEEAFSEAAARMYFPKAGALGVSPQDDSFLQKKKLDWRALAPGDFPLLLNYHPLFLYRHQICKQADTVLAHLLFPETADEATIRRSYEYYDGVTTHDSSLSICVFAVAAARLGLMERAEKSFADTVTLDLNDTHGNTRDGLHTASLGGAYLIMLMGFAGVRAGINGLSISPALPKGWNGYEIPLCYRGRRLKCSVRADAGAKLTLLEGEPLDLMWMGHMTRLELDGAGGARI